MFPRLIFIYAAALFAGGIFFMAISPERNESLVTAIAFGGIILIMGYLSARNDLAQIGRHGATAISLIAFITTVGSFAELFDDPVVTPVYVTYSKIYIAVISIIFMLKAVQQFAAERPDEPKK